MTRLWLLPALGGLYILCCTQPRQPVATGFYYWKTTLPEQDSFPSLLHRLSGNAPFYLRLFDVDYSEGYHNAVPVGELLSTNGVPDQQPLIPVVYITNRVFKFLNTGQIDTLAEKIMTKVAAMSREAVLFRVRAKTGWEIYDRMVIDSLVALELEQQVPEMQVDCDWTPATREAYFYFLEQLRKKNWLKGKKISCTIRLHQFRDGKKAGIPPVDLGMLMCYNMANPKNTGTPNAIFDLALLKGYVAGAKDYPLPLDVALPVFSWASWFRNDQFLGLVDDWGAQVLENTALFDPQGGNYFRIKTDTVYHNSYIREGDLFRLDAAADQDLLQSPGILRRLLRPGGRVVFFDWDTDKIKRNETLIQTITAGF